MAKQSLNDVVVQIAGDPVPVGVHIELALGPVLLPQLQRERGLVGERGRQRHVARFERGSVVAPQRDQDSDHGVVGVERNGEGRPVRGLTRTGQKVSRRRREHRRAALHNLAQERVAARQAAETGLPGSRPSADHEGAVMGVGAQHDRRRVRDRELQRALGDQSQRILLTRAGQQLVPDLGRGLQPLLPQLALLEQVRVVHRDPGRRGEGLDEDLVVGGELRGAHLLGAVLLGEVQVAEHRVAHPDRDAEKGPHRRMMRREPDRRLVPAEVGQPQRVLAEDELTQQPLSFGQRAHRGPRLLVEPDVDEP